MLTILPIWTSPVPHLDASLRSSYHLGIRGSLCCVISLLIPWESQLTSALFHTGWGHYRGRDPFGGSTQIATCILPMQTFSHSPTDVQHKVYAKFIEVVLHAEDNILSHHPLLILICYKCVVQCLYTEFTTVLSWI
jgi:hypothetical protein